MARSRLVISWKRGRKTMARGPYTRGRRYRARWALGQSKRRYDDRRGMSIGLLTSHNTNICQKKTLAVRDVTVDPTNWVNPIYWRDQLPREIAIQRRLHARNGHEHHVHRYYADRISFYQRKYRVFNEVCNLGCLMDALDWYSRQWRRRHNMFRWIEAHPELKDALNNADEDEDGNDAVATARTNAWDTYTSDPQYQKRGASQLPVGVSSSPEAAEIRLSDDDEGPRHRASAKSEPRFDPNFDEWETMSDIEEWHGHDVPEAIPDVIPEGFLWTVFDQLVDAFTVLGTGGVQEGDHEEHKEIVHGDVTLQNIFVKKAEKAEGVVDAESRMDANHRLVQYEAKEVRINSLRVAMLTGVVP
jgi:hypothetical protein